MEYVNQDGKLESCRKTQLRADSDTLPSRLGQTVKWVQRDKGLSYCPRQAVLN